MSEKHPIIAITGSSGAGTTYAKRAFEHIFNELGVRAAIVEGDSFHRYDRYQMQKAVEEAEAEGRRLTHFGPEGNLFDELEALFREYAEKGTGRRRWYVHNEEEAAVRGVPPGHITDWEPLEPDTDLLFYEGLHGGVVTGTVNVARYVDLLIGVVPIINLEWIQKIHRDKEIRGYSVEAATHMILSRMHDYVHYITPQFSLTDINFQRVPTVDTSNPFAATEIPSNDQSYYVVRINNRKLEVDFPYLLSMLHDSFMSAADTIVVPGGKHMLAMELILTSMVESLIARRDAARLGEG
ncbi:MAG: phosphoribulokinase [Gammaproteobacteria bacterium]|nr:MAG: phosphoribulokinase [Gammaproteobacteria bacterium]